MQEANVRNEYCLCSWSGHQEHRCRYCDDFALFEVFLLASIALKLVRGGKENGRMDE